MPLLVDGNNVLHGLPTGYRSRETVRRLVLDLARRERLTVELVFDGPPPPGRPEREPLGRVTVRYSGGASADDVIVRRLPPGRAARQWTVVTDDGGLAARARAAGASVRPSRWLAARLELRAATGPDDGPLTPEEVAAWERWFRERGR